MVFLITSRSWGEYQDNSDELPSDQDVNRERAVVKHGACALPAIVEWNVMRACPADRHDDGKRQSSTISANTTLGLDDDRCCRDPERHESEDEMPLQHPASNSSFGGNPLFAAQSHLTVSLLLHAARVNHFVAAYQWHVASRLRGATKCPRRPCPDRGACHRPRLLSARTIRRRPRRFCPRAGSWLDRH